MTTSREPRNSEVGLERLKRRSYVIALVVASVAAMLGWLLDDSLVPHPWLRVAFGPVTAMGALCAAALLGTERLPLARLERVAYVASSTLLVLRIAVSFVLVPPTGSVLAIMPNFSPWIGAVYIMAFAAFPIRRAVRMASALYAALLVLCIAFVAHRGLASFSAQDLSGLAQEFVVAHPFVISLLYFMAIVKEVLARERMERVMLDRIAHTDDLTGLANRRHVLGAAQKAIERIARDPRPFSVLLLDVDHFKRVNDLYGHAMGDAVLCAVADALKNEVRAGDDVGRFGGEEFLVLAYDADLEMAERAADRMRIAIEALTRVGLPRVTVSVGVATLGGGENLASILARTDAALYRAKHAGRNRVAVAA